MEENPETIQTEDWITPGATASSVPVFLIHDGGGATFSYHCLDPLNRPVYGIFNPHFQDGGYFEGGISEMGRLYCGYIQQAIEWADFPQARNMDGSVNILLGGWSMGGLLCLEVARQLADDQRVKVIGILMVDSICPVAVRLQSAKTAPWDTSVEGKTNTQILTQNCMVSARKMIQEWEMPRWEGSLAGKRPRAMLLRARQYAPVLEGHEGVHAVDVLRQDRNLGWESYEPGMFEDVQDVDGHHFDIFTLEKTEGITAAISKALDSLEMDM